MNIPPADSSPPNKVVRRNPILSVRTPAIGDRRNVVPIVRDPTKAAKNAIVKNLQVFLIYEIILKKGQNEMCLNSI